MALAEIKRKLADLLRQAESPNRIIEADREDPLAPAYHVLLKEYQDLLKASADQKDQNVEDDFEKARIALDIKEPLFFVQPGSQPDSDDEESEDDEEEDDEDEDKAVGKFSENLEQLSVLIEAMEQSQAGGNLIAGEVLVRAFQMLDVLQKKRKEYLDDCKRRDAQPEQPEVDAQLEAIEASLDFIVQQQEELTPASPQRHSFSAAVERSASAVISGAICAPEDMRKALEQVYEVSANKIQQHGPDNVFTVQYSSNPSGPEKTVKFNLAVDQPKHSVEFQADSTLEDYVKAAIILRAAGQRFNFDDQAMRDNLKMKALCIKASQIVGLELQGDLSCDYSLDNTEEFRRCVSDYNEQLVTQAAQAMRRPAPPRRREVVVEQVESARESLPKQGANAAGMFGGTAACRTTATHSVAPAPSCVAKN